MTLADIFCPTYHRSVQHLPQLKITVYFTNVAGCWIISTTVIKRIAMTKIKCRKEEKILQRKKIKMEKDHKMFIIHFILLV